MNCLRITLVLCCALVAQLLVMAVEVQPTAVDWYSLRTKARGAIQQSPNQIQQVKGELAAAIKDPSNLRYMTHGSDQRPLGRAALEKLLPVIENATSALNKTLIDINTVAEKDRTRDKYLDFRRRVKSACYALEQAREQVYRGDTTWQEPAIVSQLAAQLKTETMDENRIPVAPNPAGIQFSWQDFPRIDGSTTAQPLSTLIVCRLLGLGAEWRTRQIYDIRNAEGSSERILIPVAAEPPMLESFYAGELVNIPGLHVNVEHSGTHTAYRNLIVGASNFIIVARPPSPDELALARNKNIELDCQPIAYDAFCFLLNTDNPINSLTLLQIQKIYQDKVFSWSELGGNDKQVIAFQRNRNSGSQETMESLVMKGLPIASPEIMQIGQEMGSVYNHLEGERNGIGYTFYYYQTFQSPQSTAILSARIAKVRNGATSAENVQIPRLKICAISGIFPTTETIRDRSYPLVTPVYAVIRKSDTPEKSSVRLRDWLLTPEGQSLVKESGYVPLR